jgi:hypothetical protein
MLTFFNRLFLAPDSSWRWARALANGGNLVARNEPIAQGRGA